MELNYRIRAGQPWTFMDVSGRQSGHALQLWISCKILRILMDMSKGASALQNLWMATSFGF